MTLPSSGNDALLAPASGGGLPSVTLSMLEDFLSSCEILHRPTSSRRVFRWFAAVSHNQVTNTAPHDLDDARTLFICRLSVANEILKKRPTVFVLALADNEETLPQDIGEVSERLLVIRQQDRFSYFIFLIQSYFMQLLLWEGELDRIVLHHGSLTEALDASAPLLKNFMFVTDNEFNVIARTSDIEPPDNLHRRIVETGCLSPQMIAEKRFRLPEKVFYLKEPCSLTPYARLSRPLYINHTYFGSLSMSCHTAPLTEGLKDLFSLLMRHVMPLCEYQWRSAVKLNIPHYFFFQKLLEHEPVSNEYLETQLEMAGLTGDTQYKLAVFEVDESVDPDRASRAAKAATHLNQGSVFCFAYRSAVLALMYAPPSDSALSHRRTLDELEERIVEPLGITCGVSEIFEDISNLDLAYRQAKIALGLRQIVRLQFAADENIDRGIFLFGDVLMYFLVSQADKDERFMRFCFSHTVVEKIHAEDERNGTNYLALFWHYLNSGRNATAVAQRLHMHRNTVLYHIEKIQKRFDFDLSLPGPRERMLLDFKAFFLNNGKDSIKKALVDSRESDAAETRDQE
ncbi:MAG: helix-turn-helix domain-containing protein [Gordonibacter sp.]|nr:helix-turn-helix domain-containing protein [Gordonibacter sp.]